MSTLYELIRAARDIEAHYTSSALPLVKDGEEMDVTLTDVGGKVEIDIKPKRATQMNMETERYCSNELRELLKECGFQFCSMPTHQMALDWLNEKYGLFVSVNPFVCYEEFDEMKIRYKAKIVNTHDPKNDGSGEFGISACAHQIFNGTYPDNIYTATDVAIRYAIVNIIKYYGL